VKACGFAILLGQAEFVHGKNHKLVGADGIAVQYTKSSRIVHVCILSARSSSLAELMLWVGPVTRFIKNDAASLKNPKITCLKHV
jgi:hypothetical protein